MNMTKPKLTGILLRPTSTSSARERRSSGQMFYHYRTTDGRIGIVNDANRWFADPRDLVPAIQRIVHLSAEAAKIVDRLPDPMPDAPERVSEVSW